MGKLRFKLSDKNIEILNKQCKEVNIDRKAYLTIMILFQQKYPIEDFYIAHYDNSNSHNIDLFLADNIERNFREQMQKFNLGKTQYFLNLLRNYETQFK